MIRTTDSFTNWGRIVPSVLAWWAIIIVGAAITMSPTVRATPLSWDDQMFQPGALMLIESLRLHRSSFLHGIRLSLMLTAVAEFAILLARARVTAAIVDVAKGQTPRLELFSRAPAYVGVTLLKLIVLGIIGGLLFLIFRALPPLDGTLPPRLVLLYGITATLSLLGVGYSIVLVDVYRLALFHEFSPRARLHAAWSTTLRHAFPLLVRRAFWVAVGLGTGYLTLLCAARPIADGSIGAVGTFVVSQTLILMNLMAEVWWLSHAEKKLLLYSAAERADAAPR